MTPGPTDLQIREWPQPWQRGGGVMPWLHVPETWIDGSFDADDDQINILDGCSGSGMLATACELALQQRGLRSRTLVHIERDAEAAAIGVGMDASAGREAAVWDDLATFDGV